MIGAFLYQLTAKDAQTQPVLQRRVDRVVVTAALANVVAVLPAIPDDKIGFLTYLNIIGIPGGAQTTLDFRAELEDETGASLCSLLRERRVGAGGVVEGTRQAFSETMFMPKERVECEMAFSAGAIANTVIASAVWLLLPKGNVQLR